MLEEAYAMWFPLVVMAVRAAARCSAADDDDIWLWKAEDYPHPVHQPRFCNRFAPSFVCDPDRVLCKKEADALDKLIHRIRNETLCICRSCESIGGPKGITLAVAILERLHRTPRSVRRVYIEAARGQPNSGGPLLSDTRGQIPFVLLSQLTAADAVRDFAEELRRKWNLGHCDDDIVLLLSTGDVQSYTLVGPAVADVFPQEVADQIYLESRGHFSSALYYQGLRSMIQSYFDMLRRLQGQGIMFRQTGGGGTTVGLVVGAVFGGLALLAAIGAAVFWYGSRNWDYDYLVASLAESTRKTGRRLANLRRRKRPPATQPDADESPGSKLPQEATSRPTVVVVDRSEAAELRARDGSEGSRSATCTDDYSDYSSEEDGSESSQSCECKEVQKLADRGSGCAPRTGSSSVLHTPL